MFLSQSRSVIIDMMGKKNNFKNNLRTIEAQIVPKLKNTETTSLGQNLLVLIKESV